MHYAYIIDQQAAGQEVVIYRSKVAGDKSKILRLTGLVCLFLSVLSLFVVFSPIIFAEVGYRFRQGQTTTTTPEKVKISFFGYLLWLDEQNLSTPTDWQFGLIIPKIGVNSRVYPQVNPNNKEEYLPYLKTGVAHARGTALPDSLGTTYIFGHSSNLLWDANRQNAIFYHLKDLKEKDEVILFYQGQRFLYRVLSKEILNANQIPDYVSQTGEKLLVLQTCWPPGTDWKRLFILAEPVENEILSGTAIDIGL